jgi:hypothetical protein
MTPMYLFGGIPGTAQSGRHPASWHHIRTVSKWNAFRLLTPSLPTKAATIETALSPSGKGELENY